MNTYTIEYCAECNKPLDECHCLPQGCQCARGEWDAPVPPACGKFEGANGQRCTKCEHDQACHR